MTERSICASVSGRSIDSAFNQVLSILIIIDYLTAFYFSEHRTGGREYLIALPQACLLHSQLLDVRLLSDLRPSPFMTDFSEAGFKT